MSPRFRLPAVAMRRVWEAAVAGPSVCKLPGLCPAVALEARFVGRGCAVPNCASGDSPGAKLCIRRQPGHQTVHPTTARPSNCASGDNEPLKTGSGCRQTHSLTPGLSPEAQSAARAVVMSTGWHPGCRQGCRPAVSGVILRAAECRSRRMIVPRAPMRPL